MLKTSSIFKNSNKWTKNKGVPHSMNKLLCGRVYETIGYRGRL